MYVFFTLKKAKVQEILMKKFSFLVLCIVTCLVLSGCAVGWHKQGVSEYETENALAQCEYEAGKDHVERGDFVSNCMKRQGFRWY